MENMEGISDLLEKYRGKKVFLTGHTGFKGAWMLLLLRHLGARVMGYSLPPENSSLYDVIHGDSLCASMYADIQDYDRLAAALKEFQPDYIFHMAAQSLVLRSYQNPAETFATNAMGTVNVLEALRYFGGACNAVIITTDKVYEQGLAKREFKETDKLGGYDPYSASKACCELIVQSYHKSFFSTEKADGLRVKVASARSGNVIGGGDWSENRIVPDLIRSIQDNKPLFLRNPLSVRPWQHVLDALLGYVVLAAKLQDNIHETSLSWNFAPLQREDITVREVASQFFKILNRGTYEEAPSGNVWHEAPYLQLNATLAHEALGWVPRLDHKQAIEWTASWYRDVVLEGKNAAEVSQAQVAKYLGS